MGSTVGHTAPVPPARASAFAEVGLRDPRQTGRLERYGKRTDALAGLYCGRAGSACRNASMLLRSARNF